MSVSAWTQIGLYLAVLLLLAKPLGSFMAAVYEGRVPGFLGWLRPVERAIYRVCGVRAEQETDWKRYAVDMLQFHMVGFVFLYVLQRVQGFAWMPLNPANLPNTTPDLAFNTSVSFITNTNWQSYGGETTLSYLTQMLGLTVQNFVSAASGMAILVALIRGFARKQTALIGNFWVDLTRSTLYILLPLSVVLALVLVSQGVVQTLKPYATATLLQPTSYERPDLPPFMIPHRKLVSRGRCAAGSSVRRGRSRGPGAEPLAGFGAEPQGRRRRCRSSFVQAV